MLLSATTHVKVWGGRRLQTVLNKTLPQDAPYGESWELHDTAIISNGAWQGRTLGDALATLGTDMIGTGNDPADGLPLLAKFIDADDWLSVQVHPDDYQADSLEGQPRGKTEAWIILDAAPSAELVIGVLPRTSRDTLTQAIHTNTLEPYLVRAAVSAGDVLFIPAGTIHAIGPGILLYEIQQSSDTTYRLYDWGRMGLDGQPRPLHIEKGLQVSRLDRLPQIIPHATTGDGLLVQSAYFNTQRHVLKGAPVVLNCGGHFHALTCIQGAGRVNAGGLSVTFEAGQTVFMPAALEDYILDGAGVVLRSWQP